MGIINKAKTIRLSNERIELRPSAYSNDPAAITEYDDRVEALTKQLATLPARLERVLRLYYGFNIEGMTMDAISETMHAFLWYGDRLSRERVRQLLSKSRRYLLHPKRSGYLKTLIS